jgi:feruloyl esterase
MRKVALPMLIFVMLGCFPATASISCESLTGLKLRDTTITLANVVGAGEFSPPAEAGRGGPGAFKDLPAFCRVAATLRPSSDSDIKIEVWLPVSGWNGNFLAVGNGGWSGAIVYPALSQALLRGYATSSTDTGHAGGGADASFSAGHPEKLVDFAYRAVHEMTLKSKAIIGAFYGSGPKFSYWNGCSTGGRQGLMEAQRYPQDFDGIVAGAPANYMTHLLAGIVWAAQAAHKDQPGNLPREKVSLLHDAVLRTCDALDGVKDGVLEDPTRCKFDPNQLKCKGADGPACLTAEQVEAARKMYSGAANPLTKEKIYPGMARGSELGWDPLIGLQPLPIAESYYRYIVFKDPSWGYQKLDFARDVALTDKNDGGLLNATDPNLKLFFEHGGKLIQYHGWNDQQISPLNSINYFRSVQDALGGANHIADSYELFMAPGMNHCRAGDGPSTFDMVGALEQWVERGREPDQILALHVTDGKVDRTRPLCPYPQVAKFKGKGTTDEAVNFACGMP